jgi:formamidopyrimidine-DNA glycosylase
VPELPEVETARRLIADRALHRRIVAVDDADTFECRPPAPGELRDALVGCPRCGAEMVHGTVGGRSTWWCSREQAAWPDAA